jgi:hypothetical protein
VPVDGEGEPPGVVPAQSMGARVEQSLDAKDSLISKMRTDFFSNLRSKKFVVFWLLSSLLFYLLIIVILINFARINEEQNSSREKVFLWENMSSIKLKINEIYFEVSNSN